DHPALYPQRGRHGRVQVRNRGSRIGHVMAPPVPERRARDLVPQLLQPPSAHDAPPLPGARTSNTSSQGALRLTVPVHRPSQSPARTGFRHTLSLCSTRPDSCTRANHTVTPASDASFVSKAITAVPSGRDRTVPRTVPSVDW